MDEERGFPSPSRGRVSAEPTGGDEPMAHPILRDEGVDLGNEAATPRPSSFCAIHLLAGIIGEADAPLSRVRSIGYADASKARALDRVDPLATLAAVG